eukprot:TRINITY_DN14207_c0_g1_i1.p1 TRINITY_DN14207_c0_g1~~TRINITY_DN14207_c0_g1_i1.p1  ORF type:complete len:770 (-),score=68.29 TRINITY_DN14207_c0_g1_i1:85-2394(-)
MFDRRWILAFVLLSLVHHSFANIAAGTITLGVSITVGNVTNTRTQQGVQVLRGLNLWLSKINATVEIRGEKYQFVLKVLTDNGSIPSVNDNYVTLINDSTVDYLLGPIGSDVGNPLSAFLNGQPRVLLGTASSIKFVQNNPYALSVGTTASRCPLVSFPYFRLEGAKKIAFIASQSILTLEACGELTDVQAKAGGILVVRRYNWSATTDLVDDQAKSEIKEIINDLKTRSVDIVYTCAFGQTARYVLNEIRAQNYSPGFITFQPLDQQFNSIDPVLSDYITGNSRFDASALFPSDPIFGDTQQFVQSYQNMYGSIPDEYAAFGAMTGEIYQTALTTALSFSQSDVLAAMERINMNTFMGQFFFGADHTNRLSCLFVQFVNGTRIVIGPPLAQFEDNRVIYPFPKWDERSFVSQFNGYPSEWAFFTLALFFSLVSVGFIIFTAVKHKTPVIKASSPNLLFAFLVGSILLYSSLFTWTVTNVTAAGCYLQSWLLSFGFTIMFGALFAKSWRVFKLSSTRSLKIFKITDTQLLIGILLALVGDAIICIVQAAVVDMTPVLVVVDPHRPVYNYYECPFTNQTTGISAALIAYNGLICVFGLAVAWKIRKLKYPVFNESKIIAFSMYNVVFFAIIVIILQFTRATGRELLYILRSTGIILGTSISVATMFLTKLTMNKSRSGANSSLSHRNSAPPVPPVPQAFPHAVASHSSVDEKDREIERLKEKLLAKKQKMREDEAFYHRQYEDLYHQHMTLQRRMIESQAADGRKESNEA